MQKKISKSPKDTEKIALDFLKKIAPKRDRATVIALSGNLGVGKTAFTKAVAKALGVKRKVNSPTFVIIKRYVTKHKNFKTLYHIDAYRLKNKKELLHLGWKDIISNKDHLVFIEWPEQVKGSLPRGHHKVSIAHGKGDERIFKIKV